MRGAGSLLQGGGWDAKRRIRNTEKTMSYRGKGVALYKSPIPLGHVKDCYRLYVDAKVT